MKRLALLSLFLFAASGCTAIHTRMVRHFSGDQPYANDPFWVRYLTPGDPRDQQIRATLDALKIDPWSAPLHNQLGELLSKKALPKPAELEFDRAIASDRSFYPAWYNLGLIREYRGNEAGAMAAFKRTLALKPGHAAAHFQLGLLYERHGRIEAAVDHYADAIRINPQLLSANVNPRVLDTRLVDRALMRLYASAHSRASLNFEPTPVSYPSQPAVLVPSLAAPLDVPAQPTPPANPPGSAAGVVTAPIPVTGTAPAAVPKPEPVDPHWQRFMSQQKGEVQPTAKPSKPERKKRARSESPSKDEAEQPPAQTNEPDENPPDENPPDETTPPDPNTPAGEPVA